MNSVKVRCEINVYEVDGIDTPALSEERVVVESHWNRDSLAVLTVPGTDRTFTVNRSDLITALTNAGRTH